jgi:hypothetical protein
MFYGGIVWDRNNMTYILYVQVDVVELPHYMYSLVECV